MRSYGALTGYQPVGHHIEVADSHLREILQILLRHVAVDEAWYRSINGDVNDAIVAGKFSSAKEHYITAGFFEDRLPRPITVDDAWYLDIYPDVAEAIRAGAWPSSQEHFTAVGFREWRLPRPNWSLLSGSPILSAGTQ